MQLHTKSLRDCTLDDQVVTVQDSSPFLFPWEKERPLVDAIARKMRDHLDAALPPITATKHDSVGEVKAGESIGMQGLTLVAEDYLKDLEEHKKDSIDAIKIFESTLAEKRVEEQRVQEVLIGQRDANNREANRWQAEAQYRKSQLESSQAEVTRLRADLATSEREREFLRQRVDEVNDPKVRCFRHKDGFMDNTDYLKVCPDGSVWFVNKDGNLSRAESWTLKQCEHAVAGGYWVELGVAEPKVRRFRHKDGFGDCTDYIEAHPDGVIWFVNKDGSSSRSRGWTLAECEESVAGGDWEEFDVADAEGCFGEIV